MAWGIVTNKHMRFTTPVVRALGLSPRGADDRRRRHARRIAKPHPAPLLRAAQELAVAPAACVYVGDDLRDVLAGNAAGMATIVANYGYMGTGDHPTLARHRVDRHAARPADWLPVLTRGTSRR